MTRRTIVLPVNGTSEFDRLASTPPPAAPTLNSITPGDEENSLAWSSVTGATNYNVYFDTSSGVTTSSTKIIAGNVTSLTHTGLVNSTTYYYRVTAEGPGGESGLSNELFGTPTANPFTNTFSLELNGSDEYGKLELPSNLDFNRNNAYTFSIWLEPDNVTGTQSLINNRDFSGVSSGYQLDLLSGAPRLAISNGTTTITATSDVFVTESGWWHVAVTFSGNSNVSGIQFYLNGINVTKTTSGTTIGGNCTGDAIFFGTYQNLTNYYNGHLDEISIWNAELSNSEIDEIYNSGTPADLSLHSSSANLVSWWRCGDDPDDDRLIGMIDQQDNNDVTLVSGPFFRTDVP